MSERKWVEGHWKRGRYFEGYWIEVLPSCKTSHNEYSGSEDWVVHEMYEFKKTDEKVKEQEKLDRATKRATKKRVPRKLSTKGRTVKPKVRY